MKQLTPFKALFAMLVMVAGMHGNAAMAADTATDSSSTDRLARGQYLAKAGDCAACHTAPGGKPMAGGLPIDSPFGQIYSSNITPSKTDGIGNDSEEQFARAVRHGVRADGTHLYPAMPYPSYAGMTDDDINALYVYFMQGVEPVDVAPPATQLKFPFNQRWLMSGWNLLFARGKSSVAVNGKGEAWHRGHYLLGHCDSCHTPRNIAMGEKAGLGLSGGQVGPWQAPNITSDPISGIGGWSHDELVQYLRTGAVAGKGQAAGGMAEAVERSLQYLTDADLSAIATYLKDSPPIRSPGDTQPAYSYGGSGEGYEATLRANNPGIGFENHGPGYLPLTTGAQLYSAYCASCHQTRGQGAGSDAFPSLIHNSVLGGNNADNLVMVIRNGLNIHTQDNDRQMPGSGDDLNDEQVATLATFVMKQYGNPKVTVTADHVALLREGGANPSAALLPAAVGAVLLILLLIWLTRWIGRRKRARRR
jgi:mono/diheme cytochrome c family protein